MKKLSEAWSEKQTDTAKRGSVLMLAILFATIAAITIGGYINLASTELRLANRSLYFNAAMNLAEAGLEEAMYALNNDDWEAWTFDGNTATLSIGKDHFKLGKAASGIVRIQVEDHSALPPETPQITAEGRVLLPNGGDLFKQIEITLYRRSYFGNGMMAKERFSFAGQFALDSYDSSLGPYAESKGYDATLGSPAATQLELGHAKIYGSLFTGSGEDPTFKQHGEVTGEITTDFNSNLEDAPDPPDYAGTIDPITSAGSLNGGAWKTDHIKLSAGGNNAHILTITGDVELHVTGDVDLSGQSHIFIEDGASLTLYVGGNISMTGNGMINGTSSGSNTAANFTIFGTNTGEQQFDFHGNAHLQASIYAPNTDITLSGKGNNFHMSGSVVGKTITTGGNMAFHHDLALGNRDDGLGYGMRTWRELFADRIAFTE